MLCPVPHSRMAIGFFIQKGHVYRFHKYPRRLPRVLADDEIHDNIIAVLRLVNQRMDGCRLPLEEFKVFAVEEGDSDEHHGVLVTASRPWGLQYKISVIVDT